MLSFVPHHSKSCHFPLINYLIHNSEKHFCKINPKMKCCIQCEYQNRYDQNSAFQDWAKHISADYWFTAQLNSWTFGFHSERRQSRPQPDWQYEYGQDWTPKFAGQVLLDQTESGLIFSNILPTKYRLLSLIW